MERKTLTFKFDERETDVNEKEGQETTSGEVRVSWD